MQTRQFAPLPAPKRFWSGQITTHQIIETCKHYQTEMLILPADADKAEWKSLLEADYSLVSSDSKKLLYHAKRIQDLRS
jgi:hypothetical protein